jgi:hypothetical protein
MNDPYQFLSRVAEDLWTLHQRTTGEASDQAEAMYNVLETVYLEPFRRQMVESNTGKYAELTQKLQAAIGTLDGTVQEIHAIQDALQQTAQYVQVFDQVVSIAAKLA